MGRSTQESSRTFGDVGGLWHWDTLMIIPLGFFRLTFKNGTGLAIAIPKTMPQNGVSRDDSYRFSTYFCTFSRFNKNDQHLSRCCQ